MATATAEKKRQSKARAVRDRATRHARNAAQEISEIPAPPKRDAKKYRRYRNNLLAFLEECFPSTTGLKPFSESHKKIIYRIQQAAIHGGLFLQVVYRGFAKSTITENAVIWACGYGHSQFVVPIAADADMAKGIIESIQSEIETNDLLMDVFPEVCHCARHLEGIPQRASKQHIGNSLTHIEWPSSHCVFPSIKGFKGSGAIIIPKSMTASMRGMRFKRHDGEQVRPDFVLIDDPQTDESACSPTQVEKRLSKLNKAILRLGGHQKPISVVCNATIIEQGDMIDQLADRDKNPAWQAEKVPMLFSMARNESLWLEDYAEIRNKYSESIKDDQKRAHRDATEFYRQNRKKMDEGAEASWVHCFDAENEISAIQHAYNILIDTGPEAFASECQNNPLVEEHGFDLLSVDDICKKQSGYARGVVPPEASTVVAMIDVHPQILYYEVWSFCPGFQGFKIDGGCYPDQKRRRFDHTDPPLPLSKVYRGYDTEATIVAGLDDCTKHILGRDWVRSDDVPVKISRCLIDANGNESSTIRSFCRQSQFAHILVPSFGRGVLAKHAPISRWKNYQVNNHGPEWIPTQAKAGETTGVVFDANYWKTRFHQQLSLPKGSHSSLSLFRAKPEEHAFAAAAYRAENPIEVTSEGRTVFEWQQKPGHENHPFDCAVGCMVAASISGISNQKFSRPQKRTRRKVRYL